MSMRLAFAIAAHIEPDVLLLDEVLAVGDEGFQRKCFGRIADFRRGGGTLVFVSHDPGSVERVCDRAVFLRDGEVAADGPPGTVLAAYHRVVARAGSAATGGREEDDDPRVWGTQEVRIAAARLIGPDGATDRFLAGSALTVEIEVEAERPVETPNFGIAVHTAEGVPLYATNTRMDALPIAEVAGRALVTFTIPSLGLHEGLFEVSLAVASHDESVIYHWLDRWLQFSVFQRATGQGPVDLSGSWTITPGDAAPLGEPAQVRGST
jgi:hypothetical protein